MPLIALPEHTLPTFPHPSRALKRPNGLLAMGGNLLPATLLRAYAGGIFPWFDEGQPILWWSPDPRLVFDVETLRPNARMRRWLRRCPWTIRADSCFDELMHACSLPRSGQAGTWIGSEMKDAYGALHRLGHAHSIEVFEDGALIGGSYGVSVGRAFFGESMFSRRSNASKVALWALAETLRHWDMPLIDCQVSNPHLLALGAVELSRARFLDALSTLCAAPGRPGSWTEDWPAGSASALAECGG